MFTYAYIIAPTTAPGAAWHQHITTYIFADSNSI